MNISLTLLVVFESSAFKKNYIIFLETSLIMENNEITCNKSKRPAH